MKNTVYKIITLSVGLCLFLVTAQAQTRSPKRGVSFNFTNDADMGALQPGTSWFYNWGTTPNSVTNTYNRVYGYEFCPMTWNGNWDSNAIRNYVKANPDCKYLLAFNEPNFRDQANLTPTQAAARWPDLMALANELGLKVISPACNYSSWSEYSSPEKWLNEFFQYVDIDDVEGIAIHSYMGWASATQWYVGEYIKKYNKPVWLTEFCAWDDFTNNQGGTALVQRREMIDLLEYLETEPMVGRYAWFIPRRNEYTKATYPYMELLTNTNGTERGVLTETGLVWTYMSSYNNDFYHDVDACIEAEHYIARSNGIYMEQTTDDAGVINIYDYGVGGELSYNVNIPAAGEYTVRLRMLSNMAAKIDVTSDNGTVSKTIPSTSNAWEDREFLLNLNAGKQRLTFKLTEGSLKLNYLVITNTGATPEPTPNPPSEAPAPPPPVGDNLALNKPVESSSADDIGNASLLTDGKTGTNNRWESKHGQDNKYVIIDLEAIASLTDIIINWEGAYASEYTVEVSADKSKWTTVYSTTSGSVGEQRIYVDNVEAQYVKINCIKRATTYGFSIYEVEVYGALTTKITEQEARPYIQLYPNPVEDILYIQSNDLPDKVILWGINGVKLFEGKQITKVDMSDYNSGIYLLEIYLANGDKRTEKIIKK